LISDDNIQISVVLPKWVVDLMDNDAKEELRTRSKQAAKILIDHYKEKEPK
jgi:hypothetical protein